MAERSIRLYGIPLSHPVRAACAMLDAKDLPYRYVQLLAGAHPLALRALGFPGVTVPAMIMPDGARVQGSVAIAQALEQLRPEPSLYPEDPVGRAAAQRAERWGAEVLQGVPRRLIRWGLLHRLRQRQWFAQVATPLPLPAVTGVLLTPVAPAFVVQARASGERVRRDLADLPALLDGVDGLIEDQVIGGSHLGAADFQIGCSVRMLLAMQDVAPLVVGRTAETLARRAFPDHVTIPAVLPPAWVPHAGG